MLCREAEALKAALCKNEALLHGVDAAHELADVATATAEVHVFLRCVSGLRI